MTLALALLMCATAALILAAACLDPKEPGRPKTWSELWVDENGDHDWRICPCESCVYVRDKAYGRRTR